MNNDTSLQDPNITSQAQNSADKAERAVIQAQSHPSAETISNAWNSIETAEHALNQAMQSDTDGHRQPLHEVRSQLEQHRRDLSEVESKQR